MRKQIYYTLISLLFTVTATLAQERESDTLRTGVIDVVKPYTPSISDAFKVKETPNLEDDEALKKKTIDYTILSFPVASTFTPSKGVAATLEKPKPIRLYDNYAKLGAGSFTTLVGDVYLNHALSRTERIGGYVNHNSSFGDIDDILLNSGFSNTKLNANYSSELRDLSWNAEAGLQFATYNWYGLPEPLSNAEDFTNSLDVGHSFFGAHLGGDLNFEDTYINSGAAQLRYFGDNQESAELHFLATAKVDFPINREEIATQFRLDYLGGEFDRGYFTDTGINYNNIIVGGAPSYTIERDDLTVNLGVSIYYLNVIEGDSGSKFLFYPNLKASYTIVNDVLVAYGRITGDVIQNTYRNFATENPFVSPTLSIAPTNQEYKVDLGLRGKVSKTMSYTLSAGYTSENNKALFINNIALPEQSATEDYQFGNSFGLAYDNLKTATVAGALNVDVNRNFTMALKATYFNYNTDRQEEAWNLPNIEGALVLDYQINTHWYAGANLFFVGERQDRLASISQLGVLTSNTITLDSFFDANANVGYHINDKISLFAKVNNITNNDYQRWQNFQVQSLQLLAGATFKFDF